MQKYALQVSAGHDIFGKFIKTIGQNAIRFHKRINDFISHMEIGYLLESFDKSGHRDIILLHIWLKRVMHPSGGR